MYLRSIKIENVKLIRDLQLDVLRDGEPRMWTVLLGENGLCKTTLLQCIAMAASGPDRANQLADVPSLPDQRGATDTDVELQATFAVGEAGRELVEAQFEAMRTVLIEPDPMPALDEALALHIELSVSSGWSTFHGQSYWFEFEGEYLLKRMPRGHIDHGSQQTVSSLVEAIERVTDPLRAVRSRNLPGWLVLGYGVRRELPEAATSAAPRDPAKQRLESLFGKGPIIGTNFVDVFMQTDPALAEAFVETLERALLQTEDILPRITSFERRGQPGVSDSKELIQTHRFGYRAGQRSVSLPATWLSHGYQSTIAWIADLIGHAFLDAGEAVALDEIVALVLIDELDLHLHPRWQVHLVRALKRLFPKVQFIVTTHSPMMLPGFEQDEIVMLGLDDDGNLTAKPADRSPKLLTGSELFRTFFGVEKLHPDELGELLREYGYLASDPGRSDEDDERVREILARLEAEDVDPGWEPVPIDPSLRSGNGRHGADPG